MSLKRMLIATDEQGAPRVIGPVFTDESADKVYAEIEAAGWVNLGVALFTSVTDFRAEVKAARAT
jgi:hypothetical protein